MAIIPTKFYAQPNTYYISGTIESDVAIRSTYGDSYDGSGTTLTINGGSNEKFYLAQSSVPSYPQYGGKDSTFESLQLAYYTNTMDSDRNFHTPELKIYAVNPNVEITEGSLNVIDDNLTVFCSYMGPDNVFMQDSFGGNNTGFQDRGSYSKQVTTQTTASTEDYSYTITSAQIHALMIKKGEYSWDKGGKIAQLTSWAVLVGEDNKRGDNIYNLVTTAGRFDGRYHAVPAENGYNAGNFLEDLFYSLDTWIGGGAVKNEKRAMVTTQYDVVDVEFVERVTQFNSIFNYVREAPDTEDIKVQDVGSTGDSLNFFTYSKVALDSGDTKTGGASCAFHNFWENWSNPAGSGDVNSYSTQFGTSEDGCILPQTAMASIDYLPGPYHLDIGGPSQTNVSGNNNPVTSPEIELSMKVDMMAPVSVTYSDLKTRLDRGFSIIFAESYPEEDEDYMAYIKRLKDNNEVSTGLFLYAPREEPAKEIIGIPFFNLLSGSTIPPPFSSNDSIIENAQDLGRYFLQGTSTSPQSYSTGGNRNYFVFPINQWFNLTFKYGPVNMYTQLEATTGTIVGTSPGTFESYPIIGNGAGTYSGLVHGVDWTVSPAMTGGGIAPTLQCVVTNPLGVWAADVTVDSATGGSGFAEGAVITIDGASTGGGAGDEIYTTIYVNSSGPTPEYGVKDYLMAYSKDVTHDGAMQAVKLNLGDSHFGTASSGTQMELNAMSFWLNNVRANDTNYTAAATSTMKNTQKDADGFTDGDMQSVVKIDSIAFKYFNWDVKNASVNEINRQRTVSIPYPSEVVPSKMVAATGNTWPATFGLSGNIGTADNYFGQANTITHSNISIGFDDIDTLLAPAAGAGDINLLFGDFTTGNDNTVKGIDSKYISGSKSGPMSGFTAGQGVNAFAPFTTGGPLTVPRGEMNNIVTSGGALSVDDFTQKGFISVTGLVNGSGSWTRRENIFAAARVIGSNAEGTEIMVDNASIFDLPLDSASNGGTDYVMWKLQSAQNGTYSPMNKLNSAGISGSLGDGKDVLYQVKRRNGNTIYLNRPTKYTDSRQTSDTLCTSNKVGLGKVTFKNAAQSVAAKRQLGNIFISPLKYWLNLHIANVTDQQTTDLISGPWAANSWGEWFNPTNTQKVQSSNKVHSYGSILASKGGEVGTFGTTMNESLLTDGQYTRSWDLSNNPNGGIIQVETDYGFGAYEETETSTIYAGYITKTFPISGSYIYSDLSAYVKQGDVTWDSIFNFSIYPMNEQNNIENYYTINIDTKDGTRVPYLIWGLTNPPPVLNNLTITPSNQGLSTINSTAGQAPLNVDELPPNSLDFLKMKWDESNSEDIWYRYVIADDGPVYDKYHKASFYSHLNSGSGNLQRLYYSLYVGANKNWTDYSSMELVASGNAGATIEGFAGYGATVDGVGNSSWNRNTSTMEWTRDTDKASMMIHCVPSAGSGTIFEINAEQTTDVTGSAFNLSLSGNQVRANIYALGLRADGSSHISITSSTFLSGTSYLACDGKEPVMIALTYDGELPSANWKLYVDGKLEDTATYTCATGAIRIRGSPYFGGQREPASGNVGGAGGGTINNFNGRIEEVVGYNGIVLQFPIQNSIELDTTSYRDFGTKSGTTVLSPLHNNVFQARVFAADYHNIRGRTPKEIGMSNKVGWGVTGI